MAADVRPGAGDATGGAGGLRVVVADDQAAVRDGLVTLIGLLPGVTVVGAAADGEQALGLVRTYAPDVVLMDLRMPGMDGVEATRRIRAGHPGTQVVVLTTYADDTSVLDALRAGALGYLTKDTGRDGIARALRAAAAGQATLDPKARDHLLAAAGPGPAEPASPGGPQRPDRNPRPDRTPRPDEAAEREAPLPEGLTRREAEVLTLIASGLSNPAISQRLFISESTVKTHINHLFAKIGAADRAQAVRYAYTHGLAPAPPGQAGPA